VRLGKGVEGHHPFPVPLQCLHRFRVGLPVAPRELIAEPLTLGLRLGAQEGEQRAISGIVSGSEVGHLRRVFRRGQGGEIPLP
jgi:hypothetical protein